MSGNNVLVDTNIILYLLNGEENIMHKLQGAHIYISVISEIELLSFHKIKESEIEEITKVLQQVTVVDLNSVIKQNTILLRRKHKIKLPDSIILATAQYLKIPILTADKKLNNIEEIDVILYEI